MGKRTYDECMKHNLIDEIILGIYPMIMACGIHLFESEFVYKRLELVSFKQINDQLLQMRYLIKR